MASQQAQRDQNNVTSFLGVADNDSTVTMLGYIDSVTGRLLLSPTTVADNVGTLPAAPDKRDANSVTAMLGVADNDDTVLLPAIIDSRSNQIYLDIIPA